MIDQKICAIDDKNAFLFGAQGPAVFDYGMLSEKNTTENSLLFHRWCRTQMEVSGWGSAFAAMLNDPDPRIKSYALGMQCWCVLEKEIRPFISYGARMLQELEQGGEEEDYKNLVESSLDTILLRYETGMLPTEFSMKTAVPATEELCEKTAECYTQIFHQQTGKTILTEEIGDLLFSGVKKIGKLTDKTMMKRQFLKYREKRKKLPVGKSSLYRNISEDEDHDYANVCQNEWQWPIDSGEIHTETFFDLFEAAFQKISDSCAR